MPEQFKGCAGGLPLMLLTARTLKEASTKVVPKPARSFVPVFMHIFFLNCPCFTLALALVYESFRIAIFVTRYHLSPVQLNSTSFHLKKRLNLSVSLGGNSKRREGAAIP